MAPRPQNSAKGSFAKQRIIVPVGYGAMFGSYSESTDLLTANTTSLLVAGSIRLNGQANSVMTGTSSGVQLTAGLALSGKTRYFTANSTAELIVPTVSALPATRVLGGVAFVSNSTGKSLAFHSTGTTWVYTSKTSVLA